MTVPATMRQTAPYPRLLDTLVDQLTYKPAWQVTLLDRARGQGSSGLTLSILISTPDSYAPQEMRQVMHYMPVPPAAYDERSWQRWLFEQILLVERHEAMEFFQINHRRPYAPNHGPGRDPYQVMEIGTAADAETSYLGVRAAGSQP